MEDISPEAMQLAALAATSTLAGITCMIRIIRDRVAPAISERDLKFVDSHHSVRLRISPHPTLRRATMAAEAAQAAMRRTHECVSVVQTLLHGSALHLGQEAAQAEARHWAQQAMQHIETIVRAHAAVARELARVHAGTATVVDMPAPG